MIFNLRLSKEKISIIFSLLLAFFVSSRGVVSGGADIFLILMSFVFAENVLKIKISRTFFCSWIFLMFLYLTSSVINEVSDFSLYYYFSLFYLFKISLNQKNLGYYFIVTWSAINFLIVVLILLSMLSIVDMQGLVYSREGGFRAAGLITNPNYYGYMNFISFALCSQVIFRFKKIVMIFLFLGVLLSLSRGVILGMFCFVFINYFSLSRVLFVMALIFIISFFSLNFDLLPEGLAKTMEYRFNDANSGNLSGRSDIWEIGLNYWLVSYKNILFGFGFDEFQNITGLSNTVHNAYLRILYEQGILALLVFLFFVIYSIVNSRGNLFAKKSKYAILVGVLVSWFSNDYHLVKETMILIALISMKFMPEYLASLRLKLK